MEDNKEIESTGMGLTDRQRTARYYQTRQAQECMLRYNYEKLTQQRAALEREKEEIERGRIPHDD